jgi:uncharacterized repeat protein (TIGR03803 family)
MRTKGSVFANILMVLLGAALLSSIPGAFASGPTEQLLTSFVYSTGDQPDGGLVADKAGNLYGTTPWGGAYFAGMVFELSPPAAGGETWTQTVIHSFQGGGADGSGPYGTLTFDAHGNLYGTTADGGTNNNGTVFGLSPPTAPGGNWTETVLFFFPTNGSKGTWPFGKLEFDSGGNLYGTTLFGGSGTGNVCPVGGCGTVFKLSPPAAGEQSWRAQVLYSFGSSPNDGLEPGRGLLIHNGAIYGTTQEGAGNCGTVFQLVPTNGVWTENVLFTFGSTACGAMGGLIVDPSGNLYGTARVGGAYDDGVVVELSPPAAGQDSWTENTLYVFTGHGDGAQPFGSLVRDHQGNLYGTTGAGGIKSVNGGTVFRLSPPAAGSGGGWKEVVLHAFAGGSDDGMLPQGDLLLRDGSLYGTTVGGGNPGPGTVFMVTP